MEQQPALLTIGDAAPRSAADRTDDASMRTAAWRRPLPLLTGAYVVLTAATMPFFMGDTVGYADAIAQRRFTDFGHFGWYLLGYVASELLTPLVRLFVGADPVLENTLTLIVLNWFAGLAGVLLMYSVVYRLTRATSAAAIASVALMVSLSFLDFAQSGCSYVFGMTLLLLGLWVLIRDGEEVRSPAATALLGGASLFGAVAVWFTYVFAVPGALLAPALLFGLNRRRVALAFNTGVVLSILLLVTFGAGGYVLGIRSMDGVQQWIVDASHGVRGMKGIPRMIFGVGRSFIDTGNDGPMMKAYLAKDPYNPVSLADLLRTSLWKLALFYGFVFAMTLNLLRSSGGRRVFAVLAISAAPVLMFAAMWQGAAIERYLLLFPAFFLALGCSIANRRAIPALKYASIAFVALMAVVNIGVMATPVQQARQRAVVERIGGLEPMLRPSSVLATVTQLDEVWAFSWTFPFHPLNASRQLTTYHIVEPGTNQALEWRELFAERALEAWRKGGDVWLSRRALSPRPLRDWKWVEGDDPEVPWVRVPEFFTALDVENPVGSSDGFVRLSRSDRNVRVLSELAAHRPVGVARAGASSAP